MITASHLTYLLLCHRKLWLHHRQVRMEDNSADVAVGKQIDRHSYARRSRRWRQLDLGHLKIDHFDPVGRILKETKKSPKLEHVHVAQVKYYLRALELRGIAGVTGLVEYPRQKRSVTVELSDTDREETIPTWEEEVDRVVSLETCPVAVKKPYCTRCAFHDFCYV